MNLEKVPEPWRTQMQQKGISSIRDFSRKSGVSVETVRQAVYGTRRSSPSTAQALADTLGVEVAHVNEWLGYGRSDTSEPYEPPAEASRLTTRQRNALDELIRSMTTGAAGATQAEDQAGSHPDVQSTRDRTPIDLAQARRVKDDPAAFGDQARRGDLDQGKLQPPPPAHQSAAYEPRDESEGIQGADESRDRGEENQDDA